MENEQQFNGIESKSWCSDLSDEELNDSINQLNYIISDGGNLMLGHHNGPASSKDLGDYVRTLSERVRDMNEELSRRDRLENKAKKPETGQIILQEGMKGIEGNSEVQIYPSEYTYDDTVEFLKGKGLYLMSILNDKDAQAVEKLIKDEILPPGEYWAANGEKPDPEDVAAFVVLEPEKRKKGFSSFSIRQNYSSQKCKVAVRTSKPASLGNWPHFGDKQ